MTYTIGDMISKKLELKAFVESEQQKLDEWLKPYKEAMNAIDVACGVALQAQKLQNFKGEDGTAYLKHSDGIKVDNKSAFLQFVRENDCWGMADVGCLVEPIREYLEQKAPSPSTNETFAQRIARQAQALPPGIKFNPSVTCIIRR